ncbi:hypothetical protein [Paracidovorax sp. MALMAid1276]|uniref:hypothetical protein n=1 Tax=Paracidovorax sp. MALMAid1276 TaxID=3411631 RepID=UPI003B9B9C50
MRRLLAVILLWSVICQAFGAPRLAGFGHDGAFDASHVQMHVQGAAHHHDDEGLAHQDDSQESLVHMLSDGGPSSAALLPCPQFSLSFTPTPAPAVAAHALGPPPYLDGLRRPPRTTS